MQDCLIIAIMLLLTTHQRDNSFILAPPSSVLLTKAVMHLLELYVLDLDVLVQPCRHILFLTCPKFC